MPTLGVTSAKTLVGRSKAALSEMLSDTPSIIMWRRSLGVPISDRASTGEARKPRRRAGFRGDGEMATGAQTKMTNEDKVQVRYDPKRNFIHIMLAGFWDETTVTHYDRCIDELIANLVSKGRKRGTFLTLVDIRGMEVSTQPIVERLKALAIKQGVYSHRTALVNNSALRNLQAKRVTAESGQEIFFSEAEALDWLFEA